MKKDSKIYVAGHMGMAGSAIGRELEARGYKNVYGAHHRYAEGCGPGYDLTNQEAVTQLFKDLCSGGRWLAPTGPVEYVFLAAARVGGIIANSTMPAQFIYENLMIEANVIDAAYRFGVKKLLFLGTSCIYPKYAAQPIRESYLMTGPVEPTNEWYAVAKIAGVKLCQAYRRQYGCDFVAAMPTNLYGPNDNYDLKTGHVVPVLIRKFHEAKQTSVPPKLWGDGSALREFLHADDLAAACVTLMESETPTLVQTTNPDEQDSNGITNIGSGRELPIRDLAAIIAKVVGYDGPVEYDNTKPNGTPRKLLMDNTRINALGWHPKISLEDGIARTYEEFKTGLTG